MFVVILALSCGTQVVKYELVQLSTGITWTAAKAQAAQMMNNAGQPGFLATITDSADMATINSLVGSSLTVQSPGCWLGATRAGTSSGGWEWVHGGAWAYTNWETGEPQAGRDYLGVSINGAWERERERSMGDGCRLVSGVGGHRPGNGIASHEDEETEGSCAVGMPLNAREEA